MFVRRSGTSVRDEVGTRTARGINQHDSEYCRTPHEESPLLTRLFLLSDPT